MPKTKDGLSSFFHLNTVILGKVDFVIESEGNEVSDKTSLDATRLVEVRSWFEFRPSSFSNVLGVLVLLFMFGSHSVFGNRLFLNNTSGDVSLFNW